MYRTFWLAAIVVLGLGAAQAADVAAGRQKSIRCVSCHGAEGISVHELWPNLAGQNREYLARQLRRFRKGTRTDPWMSPMARGLTDQDIEDLAAYFSTLERRTPRHGR